MVLGHSVVGIHHWVVNAAKDLDSVAGQRLELQYGRVWTEMRGDGGWLLPS